MGERDGPVMEAVGGDRAKEWESEVVLVTWHEARVGDRWLMTFTGADMVSASDLFSLSPESTLSILKQELFRDENVGKQVR